MYATSFQAIQKNNIYTYIEYSKSKWGREGTVVRNVSPQARTHSWPWHVQRRASDTDPLGTLMEVLSVGLPPGEHTVPTT